VLVERAESARDGSTVVAVVDGEVTLKRLYRDNGAVRLQPANAALEPQVYPAYAVEIRGIVRGVVRRT
jgi:repressor LexA